MATNNVFVFAPRNPLALVILFALGAIACGDDDGAAIDAGSDAVTEGLTLYMEPHDDGNTFACATCHALSEPAADDKIRPGHPIGDAAARPSYKNGTLDELLDAVNVCRNEWMGARAFEPGEARWRALEAFLTETAPETAPPLSFEIVEPPDELSGGDVDAGREIFNGRCIVCHGEDATGTERAPPLDGGFLVPETIARRVRTSGRRDSRAYLGLTGGRMPFWAPDRLSDDQLLDVIAFVDQNDPDNIEPMTMMGELRSCDATHPKVGQTAELATFAHGVTGTATIQDDCTVRIDNFNFDGQGIDVQLYGGLGGNFELSMSDDIRRSGGYVNETIFAQLPESSSLDEIDAISVWCVPVGVSFGDGSFSE